MRSLAVFTVLACLGAVAYAGIQPKSVLTEIMKGLLENNRDKLANLQLDIDLKEHGRLNVTLTGVEKVEILQLEAPGPLSLKISNATIALAVAALDGLYELKDVNIPELGIGLNGQGQISTQIVEVLVSVALDCAIKGLTFQIKDFHDFAPSVQEIKDLVLEGIEDSVVLQLANWIPSYVQTQLPVLAEENKAVILEKINEVLAGLTY